MQFCPPNVTLHEVWVNHGVSLCFMDTVSSSVLFGYIVIFGALQHFFYCKYATPYEQIDIPRSFLYKLQIVFTLCLPLLSLIRLLLQGLVMRDHVVYGYMILTAVCQSIYWPFSLTIVRLERRYVLPSIPTRGHGLMILLFWTLSFVNENLAFLNLRNEDWWFHNLESITDKVEMVLFILRYLFTLLVFGIGLKAPGLVREIGLFSRFSSSEDPIIITEPRGSTFRSVCAKIKQIAPFVWPKKSIALQGAVLFCIILLIVGRGVNLMTPLFYKHIVDSLTDKELIFRWDLVMVYIALWSMQGGGTGNGLLNNLRSFLWIKVQQYTTRETELYLFSHLHSLSLRWHLSRKTGEVLKIMDRGTSSMNTLLSYVMFNIVPTIADIIIATVYFSTAFSGWFGLILFVTMAIYLGGTIAVTEWRTKFRRTMNLLENAAEAIAVDSLLNFETVKYYVAEDYEMNRYREAVVKFQKEEWKTIASLTLLNVLQNGIMACGLLAGMLLCAHMVVEHQSLTVGDFVLFASYTLQFYAPLNWFGTYYRLIQRAFIDMENMFALLKEKQEIFDVPNAPDLQLSNGLVEFKNVYFAYTPERTILKNISFTVQPGETVAFVGPTGAGKSTLVRLLFRMYDVYEGAILIDQQDISKVAQKSLRQLIGVVPQDTVLFNSDIRFNIRYGRVSATDSEVENAAQAAEIHNSILTFPQGYETVVGERGLKLSGGEKQRVAIARTILKGPQLVLLDEATSALDTQTERNIQAALTKICANKTTVIVAHRLSTIIHSNLICVLQAGEIVERGTHEELLAMEGEYSQMWQSQQKQYSQVNASDQQ